MNHLSKCQEAINNTISIGKSLGDAFAWFFYQKSRHYLIEHIGHEEIFHSPPGIGGAGEMEFVKNVHHINGYLIIYHGTTNILRLGDISLIDLERFEVAGIGEIKSNSTKNSTIEIKLLISTPRINAKKFESGFTDLAGSSKKDNFLNKLPPKLKTRLQRQLSRIGKSYDTLLSHSPKKLNIEIDGELATLENIIINSKRGKFTYEQATKGLLLGAYKNTSKNFNRRVYPAKNDSFINKIAGVEKHVQKLIHPDRQDNSLLVGTFFYNEEGRTSYLLGMSHLFWWPIKLATLKDIFFQEVVVFTFFNPSHLCHELELAGFTVKQKEAFNFLVSKKYGDKVFQIESMHYYLRMVQEHLIAEKSIARLISEMDKHVNSKQILEPTRIGMRIHQEFGKQR